jgi:hypothetical protein
VWLSPNNARRIPWTPALTTWFDAHFTKIGAYNGVTGQLYTRATP